jgi:hypothetical protein
MKRVVLVLADFVGFGGLLGSVVVYVIEELKTYKISKKIRRKQSSSYKLIVINLLKGLGTIGVVS